MNPAIGDRYLRTSKRKAECIEYEVTQVWRRDRIVRLRSFDSDEPQYVPFADLRKKYRRLSPVRP